MVVDHVSTATLAEMAAPYNPRRISPHDLERWQEFTGKAAEGWRGNGRAA